MHTLRVLTLASMVPLPVGGAVAQAPAEAGSTPDAPAAESALAITNVVAKQSCRDDEWTADIGPADENALIALLGTSAEFEISLEPDGITASLLSNCTLELTVEAKPGVSYALSRISYEGRASLGQGMIAEQSVSYGFVGGATSPRVVRRMVGPHDGEAAMVEPFPESGMVWSRCDAAPEPLQIRTSLYLQHSDLPQSGHLSMSLGPGVQMLVLDFVTRPCSTSAS